MKIENMQIREYNFNDLYHRTTRSLVAEEETFEIIRQVLSSGGSVQLTDENDNVIRELSLVDFDKLMARRV